MCIDEQEAQCNAPDECACVHPEEEEGKAELKERCEWLEQSFRECDHELAATIDQFDRSDNFLKQAAKEIYYKLL